MKRHRVETIPLGLHLRWASEARSALLAIRQQHATRFGLPCLWAGGSPWAAVLSGLGWSLSCYASLILHMVASFRLRLVVACWVVGVSHSGSSARFRSRVVARVDASRDARDRQTANRCKRIR